MKLNIQAKMVISIVVLLAVVSLAMGVAAVLNARHQLSAAVEEKAKSDTATAMEIIDLLYPGPWTNKNGVLYKGNTIINDNIELVDKIAKLTEDTVTIFLDDTRVTTNIIRDGKRAVGTKAADNVAETVLRKEQVYRGEANVLGINYYANYSPLKDGGGRIIGMLYLGVSKQFTDDLARGFILKLIGFTLLTLVAAVVAGWQMGKTMAKPIMNMAGMVEQIAGGNLAVKEIAVTSTDEVGKLGQGLNMMLKSLRTLVNEVAQLADNLAASAEELNANADQNAHAITHVAETAAMVAEGANRQMDMVHQSTAVSEQISVGINQVAANANDVAKAAGNTAQTAYSGRQEVQAAVEQMHTIERTVNHSSAVIAKLGGRSEEIGRIVETISGIAGQTDLLALNAAIEAARAGEQGRGFAVVAEEVRKLAVESQAATNQITQLIIEIQADTGAAIAAMQDGTREAQAGIKAVNVADETFNSIAGLVDQVVTEIREISVVTQQIAAGSQEVVASVNKISEICKDTAVQTQNVSAATQEQAASMQQIAAASQALAKLSESLKHSIDKFTARERPEGL